MYVSMYACIDLCVYGMYTCMCVCMGLCMYVYMNGCMYVWMYVWMSVLMFACMHARMPACRYVCMYVSMYVCPYVCVCGGWGGCGSPSSTWLQQRWRQAVANLAPATRQARADTAHYTVYVCAPPPPPPGHTATGACEHARPHAYFFLINGKLNLLNWKMGVRGHTRQVEGWIFRGCPIFFFGSARTKSTGCRSR